MPHWFWAASGILAALLTLWMLSEAIDSINRPYAFQYPWFPPLAFTGLVYFTAWIWSHT